MDAEGEPWKWADEEEVAGSGSRQGFPPGSADLRGDLWMKIPWGRPQMGQRDADGCRRGALEVG